MLTLVLTGRVKTISVTAVGLGLGAVWLLGAMTIGLGAASAAASSPAPVVDFGNPGGHFPVPRAGRAVDTRRTRGVGSEVVNLLSRS